MLAMFAVGVMCSGEFADLMRSEKLPEQSDLVPSNQLLYCSFSGYMASHSPCGRSIHRLPACFVVDSTPGAMRGTPHLIRS